MSSATSDRLGMQRMLVVILLVGLMTSSVARAQDDSILWSYDAGG